MEKPLRHVYTLSYMRPSPNGGWEGQFIGVYSSLEQVEKAQERLRAKPDYRDYPEGFHVDGVRLDEDYDSHDFIMLNWHTQNG